MEGASWLLLLCVAMFFGSYFAGLAPLSLSLSPSRQKKISLLGAGLLVGTALIVIIPEGVHMLYGHSSCAHEEHSHRMLQTPALPDAQSSLQGLIPLSTVSALRRSLRKKVQAELEVEENEETSATTEADDHTAADEHDHVHGADSHSGGSSDSGHYIIGAALAFGFAFQVVVDRLAGSLHSHGETHVHAADEENGHAHSHGSAAAVRVSGEAKSISALVGLLVHAFCDGIALGSALVQPESSTSTALPSIALLVFIAIMLHKGPSAFGLTAYLMTQGLSNAGVQTRLLMFSSAAPLGTVITYLLLSANLFSYSQMSVAACLLFSGGTFLYVATAHILPEIQHSGNRKAQQDDDSAVNGGEAASHYHLSWTEVGYLVGGVLLPLLMNFSHGH